MINVIVLESSKNISKHLINELENSSDLSIEHKLELQEAEAAANEKAPAVLIIGPSASLDEAVFSVESLAQSNPDIACVLLSDVITSDNLQRALRAGFRDVVASDSGDLLNAVYRAYRFIAPKSKQIPKNKKGRVITFISTKGGVGKTFFATNTAIGLASNKSYKVVLLDTDFQSGDVGIMLGLKPDHTLDELLPVIDRLDQDMFKWFLAKHKNGLNVLLTPSKPERTETPPKMIEKILDVANTIFDFIIIDTPSNFGPETLNVVNESDCIMLVTTLDVPSIKNTKVVLQTLKLLNYGEDKIKILLNRSDSKVSLQTNDVAKNLEHPISLFFPSDRTVPMSVNEGTPLILDGMHRPLVNSLNILVEMCAGLNGEQAKKTKK